VTQYNTIGRGYRITRHADPRIAAMILDVLGSARTVVNVGAGTGSYEPTDRFVVAVEPSVEMIRQRRQGTPVVQSVAESLPFGERCFDAATALLSAHHFSDMSAGLREMKRVARRLVIFTFDYGIDSVCFGYPPWLFAYLPELRDFGIKGPTLPEIERALGPVDVRTVSIPRDCTDGFGGAFWARPEAYLRSEVRRGMSAMALAGDEVLAAGLERLAADLTSGHWDRQFGHLRALDAIDLGYRLVIHECAP
jgi:SAM-dependent methyltransferase